MRTWQSGDRVIVRGEQWTVLETAAYGDCATVRLLSAGGTRVRTFVLPFDRPRAADVQAAALRVVRPRRALHHLRRAAVRLRTVGGLDAAVASAIELMPFQFAPALAMLRHGWPRLLVADEPGLGKTVQAGLIASELRARSASARVLIAVPAGLRAQWAAEMAARFRIVPIVADAAWLRTIAAELPAGVNPWTLPDVYLVSIDFVKRPEVLRPLEDVRWDLLIVDEAHGLATGTDRRAALHAIACRAERVVLLTATPHDSDASEQAALRRLGAIAPDAPWIAFRRARWTMATAAERRSRIVAVRPSDAERRMHRLLEAYTRAVWREAASREDPDARLAAIVLRKRALSSAASLALSVRRRLELLVEPPVPDQHQMLLPLAEDDALDDAEPIAALAAPGLTDARRERRWLSAILETARHAALHESKLQRLLRLLRRLNEPAIVFTEYRDTLARIRNALAVRGLSPVLLHGGMSLAERGLAQQAFDADARVLLATDAASEGLNLQTRCRVVIHYELPWNPARLEQRAGRVDRIGQRRRVHEMALVADDTAERLVLEPIARRAVRARRCRRTTRLLDALSESHVAAAVMGDPDLSGMASAGDGDVLVHDSERQLPALLAEAQAEVARLALLRQWSARSCRTGDAESRPIVSVIRPRAMAVAAVLVHQLSGRGANGRLWHGELVGLRVPIRPVRVPRSSGDIRLLAERLLAEVDPFAGGILQTLARDRLAEVWRVVEAAREKQRARAREIEAAEISAARRLVQRGLFDRRPLHRSPAPPLHRPSAERLAQRPADPELESSIEARLIALLLLPAGIER